MNQLLLVGLGNPGSEFDGTRHNLGWVALKAWIPKEAVMTDSECQAMVAEARAEGKSAKFLFPSTFMNNSGRAVKCYMDYYKMQVEQLVVIHDDMELPLGEVKVQEGGSAHGHNGVRSIEAALGSQEFRRLRLGVGRPSEGTDPSDYVLGKFGEEEKQTVDKMIREAGRKLDGILLLSGLNPKTQTPKPK